MEEEEQTGETSSMDASFSKSVTPVLESSLDPLSLHREESLPVGLEGSAVSDRESVLSFNRADIFTAIEVIERDSVAIAQSFNSLFDSLRLALSQSTSSTVAHMQVFSDAAGRLQESVLDAATKGNRYINSCLRLNEEIKGIDNLAAQLKMLRRNVDTLDSAVNNLLHLA